MEIDDLRQEYSNQNLDLKDLESDPFKQFEVWFTQAINAQLIEPNAMSLATVSADQAPSIRSVLLKFFDQKGFVFFTNYQSTKAKQMAQNPNVALMFPWLGLERQVTILGRAEKVTTAESLRYFASRPRGSQLGAWVSQQSSVITSRSLLEMKFNEIRQKFAHGEVPLPDFWGGYRVVPQSFEFWQGRSNRLHDRFLYTLEDDETWNIERLAP